MPAIPANLNGWRQCVADLLRRQARNASERDRLTELRRSLGLSAVQGDPRAQRKVAQYAAQAAALSEEASSIEAALERGQREIAAAESAAAAAARTAAQDRFRQQLADRLELVADVETTLRGIVPKLAALEAATRSIEAMHASLGGARATLPPLAAEAVGGRLAEFMTGIGFAQHLPLARPEIRPAIASWVEAEALAQRNYHLGD